MYSNDNLGGCEAQRNTTKKCLLSLTDFSLYVLSDSVASCCRENLVDKGGVDSVSIWLESWTATKAVVKVPTFQIIVLQGLVGSLPWTAMVFFTLWFELIG